MNFWGKKKSKEATHQIKHPFNRDKVNLLIDLEETFLNKTYDVPLLDQLCSYYSVSALLR